MKMRKKKMKNRMNRKKKMRNRKRKTKIKIKMNNKKKRKMMKIRQIRKKKKMMIDSLKILFQAYSVNIIFFHYLLVFDFPCILDFYFFEAIHQEYYRSE